MAVSAEIGCKLPGLFYEGPRLGGPADSATFVIDERKRGTQQLQGAALRYFQQAVPELDELPGSIARRPKNVERE